MYRRWLTMLSPSDSGEAQSEELCSFLCVFLRALRRFISNAPEQEDMSHLSTGAAMRMKTMTMMTTTSTLRATSSTAVTPPIKLMVSLLYVPPEELHKWRIKKRRWDNVAALEEEGVSVMESLTHQRRGDGE